MHITQVPRARRMSYGTFSYFTFFLIAMKISIYAEKVRHITVITVLVLYDRKWILVALQSFLDFLWELFLTNFFPDISRILLFAIATCTKILAFALRKIFFHYLLLWLWEWFQLGQESLQLLEAPDFVQNQDRNIGITRIAFLKHFAPKSSTNFSLRILIKYIALGEKCV